MTNNERISQARGMRDKIAEILKNKPCDGEFCFGEKSCMDKCFLPISDQIQALPITTKFKCDECGGEGTVPEIIYGEQPDIVLNEITHSCPNPHCHNGEVEMTLCAWAKCKHDPCAEDDCSYGFYGTHESACTPDRDVITPLTYATIGNYKLKDCEWRVM